MPSSRPNINRPEKESDLLERKLRLLEEMLDATEGLRKDPHNLDRGQVESFRQKISALVADAKEVDSLLNASEPSCGDQRSEEEKELKRRIQNAVSRLTEANLGLVASVKAQQLILGEKIAKLRDKKDLLKSYRPDLQLEPSWIDSDA